MAEIPTREPSEIVQGWLLEFKKSFASYPANQGWTLSYAFRGASKQDFSTDADGLDFLASEDTSTWAVGDYWFQGTVTKDTQKHVVSEGTLKIKVNLASITSNTYDGRSHVKKVLDALQSAVEGRATGAEMDILEKQFGDKVIRKDPALLMKWLSQYKRFYRQELAAQNVNNGLGSGRKVMVRFK